MTKYLNEAQNATDINFAKAVKSKDYSRVTQLITDGSIDPNEVLDAGKQHLSPLL